MQPIIHYPQNKLQESNNNSFEELKVNPEFARKLHLYYRTGKFSKKKSKKSKFTKEEDEQLRKLVKQYGENEWAKVSKHMKNRNPRQVRERWKNYLNPQVNTDKWTAKEDSLLISKFNEIGPHWKKISHYFENRSVNAIRNRFVKITSNNKYLMTNSFNFSSEQFQNRDANEQNTKCSFDTENTAFNASYPSCPVVIDDNKKDLIPSEIDPKNNLVIDFIQQPNYGDDVFDSCWDSYDNDDLDFLFS